MGITTAARRAAGLVAVSLLVAAGASGCGSGETKVACAKVVEQFNSINTQAVSKGADVQAMKKVYDDGAATLREIAKGTDIQDETEQAAAALERLGKQLADFAAKPSATMPQVDTKSLVDAGAALQNACL
jgi:hypothetical protein